MKPGNEPDASSHGWAPIDTDTDTGKDPVNKEAMKSGSNEPTKRSLEPKWGVERELRGWELKSDGGRKRRYASCAFTSLSGTEIGKTWNLYRLATGFYRLWAGSTRLFPHNSTQVVDFPHLANVRIFLDANLASQARHETVAPVGCSLARNVVTNECELGKDIGQEGFHRRRDTKTQRQEEMGFNMGKLGQNHRDTKAQRQAKLASMMGRLK